MRFAESFWVRSFMRTACFAACPVPTAQAPMSLARHDKEAHVEVGFVSLLCLY